MAGSNWPAGLHLTRRQLLVGAGGALAAASAAGAAARFGLDGAPATTMTPGTLVLIELAGGNDGLDTVIPAGDSRYQAARGGLAHAPADLLDLGQGSGLHPALTGLHGMWVRRQLAIVRGVGYPSPVRSHFRSRDIWHSAVPDRVVHTGWIGRWLDRGPADPLRAIAIGSTLPPALVGATVAGAAVSGAPVAGPHSAVLEPVLAGLAHPGTDRSALETRVATSMSDWSRLQRALGGSAGRPPASRRKAGNTLGTDLALVAAAMVRGVPAQVWHVTQGGFDTHAGESARRHQLLSELDGAVTGFFGTLGSLAVRRRVVVVTYSEFGRRVALNASGGTDHGAAAPMLIAGPAVRAGFHGEEPPLDRLTEGDLRATVDFRDVYAALLEQVLNSDFRAVLDDRRKPLTLL